MSTRQQLTLTNIPGLPPGNATQAGGTAAFFELADALMLTEAENRALLDVPADAVAQLRNGAGDLRGLDQRKLQRRLDYAIPILRRMLEATQ